MNIIRSIDLGCTLTYGTYDLLHFGHINLLKKAKNLGLPLGVGLSTDEFNRIKGKNSFHSYEERLENLSILKLVDFIFPEESWEQKKKDIEFYSAKNLAMGSDWEGHFSELQNLTNLVFFERTSEISSSLLKSIINLGEQ